MLFVTQKISLPLVIPFYPCYNVDVVCGIWTEVFFLSDIGAYYTFCDIYRMELQRLYQDLPEDKIIWYGTMKQWKKSLLRRRYTPGSVNAFLSAANSYVDYIGHREYQLAGQLKEGKPPQPEFSRTEYLHLLQTAKSWEKRRYTSLLRCSHQRAFLRRNCRR